jgi:hypothetical protein
VGTAADEAGGFLIWLAVVASNYETTVKISRVTKSADRGAVLYRFVALVQKSEL